MRTASPPKACRSPSCSCSFTNAYAAPSPTAASTINPMPNTDPKAGSRPPTIVPMPRSKRPSICSPPLDAAASHCCTRLVKQAFRKNLACYGVRNGLLWAWITSVIAPVLALVVALPMHWMGHFTYDWVSHLGPIYVATIIYVLGAVLALMGLSRSPSPAH